MNNNYELFHYDVLQTFNEYYFQDIINSNNLSEEMCIKDEKTEEYVPYWVAISNKKRFLMNPKTINHLPIKITCTSNIYHASKVFNFIQKFSSVSFKPDRKFSMREMINDYFINFEHENPPDYLDFNLDMFTAYVSRVNIRYATDAGFGKNSNINIYSFLRNDASAITPTSVPAIEYRLNQRLLGLDELGFIPSASKDVLQNILLTCGDMRNVYQKSSRGSGKHGTQDSYNLKNLSLVIFYNHLDYYINKKEENKFFDFKFTEAVCDRYLPLKLNGSLNVQKFQTLPKGVVKKIADENKGFYVSLIRSIQWYIENWHTEVKQDWIDRLEIPKLKGRHSQHFLTLIKFRSIYAKDFEEFKHLCDNLYNHYNDYNKMIKDKNEQSVFSDYEDEPMIKVKEEVI
jgi:hypothetical protein